MNFPVSSSILRGVAILFATIALTASAAADPAGATTDPVTGYQCVSQGCQTVRLPNANCICVKQNPGEGNVAKVRLACSTVKAGHWVACPVKPRYGISTR